MSAALGDYDAADLGSTSDAGQIGPLVDAVGILKAATVSVGIHVIGYRGSTAFDGFSEDFLNRKVKAEDTRAAEGCGNALRMDAGAEQGFIGIDIAHAAEHGLVEENRFDRGFALRQASGEILGQNLEWFGAKGGDAGGKLFAEFDAAELAGVFVEEFTTIEGKDGVGPFGAGSVDEKLTGHAEMDYEPTTVEADTDEFAEALDGFNAASGEALRGGVGISDEYAKTEEFGIEDETPGERGAKSADYSFDFGKFGHG